MAFEDTITTLNSLVEINLDRIEGYDTASKESKDMDLKALFKKFAENSNRFNLTLNEQIILLSGESIN